MQAAVFELLNPFARVVMCGMVSQYNEAELPPGPNLGFVVRQAGADRGADRQRQAGAFAEWRALARPLVADGSLTVSRGHLWTAWRTRPAALAGILSGQNFGKLLVKVG